MTSVRDVVMHLKDRRARARQTLNLQEERIISIRSEISQTEGKNTKVNKTKSWVSDKINLKVKCVTIYQKNGEKHK